MKKLESSFFNHPAYEVAPDLVGCYLVSRTSGEEKSLLITETEAYYGQSDSACHAHRGLTKRNRVLFREAGVLYIYLCYGIHHLLNVVTGKKGHPEAVLIRACERAAGPGRLTKALGITTEQNELVLDQTDLIEFWSDPTLEPKIKTAPRVGIGYADEDDQARLWRFILDRK